MQTNGKPGIVFVHGIWADGSAFSKLIPTLQDEGFQVYAAQICLDSLEGDVAAVRLAMSRVNSPVVLVGHSYGGTVISAAGTDERVAGLVYLAALAPDDDETSQNLLDKYPKTEIFDHVEVADGRVWMRPEAAHYFAGDLPVEEQQLIYAVHKAPSMNLFNEKIAGAAWKTKPTSYVVATNDLTVPPELQRFVAERMHATVTEVDSSHVPMLSRPRVVLGVIHAAADQFEMVSAAR